MRPEGIGGFESPGESGLGTPGSASPVLAVPTMEAGWWRGRGLSVARVAPPQRATRSTQIAARDLDHIPGA